MDDAERGPDAWTWQFCRGDYDITGDFYAAQDADQVRVWDDDLCLLAVVREKGGWRIATSDLGLPDAVDDRAFPTPADALDWFTAAISEARDTTSDHIRHTAAGSDAAGNTCSAEENDDGNTDGI